MQLVCGSTVLDLSQPKIMGVLNVTPDSFYDGGQLFSGSCLNVPAAIAKAQRLVEAGAAIIDIGGESTRPGAESITEQQECDRVLPVVEALAKHVPAIISVDTSSPSLMRQAAALGAGLVNDVRALSREGAVQAVATSGLAVCLMHMQGQPQTMQQSPSYEGVVAEVKRYLLARAALCEAGGIAKQNIVLDPGFGFGKTDAHNLALLHSLTEFVDTGHAVLVGFSRKSMIGRILERELDQRLAGSLALGMVAMQRGAKILRVHDVAETLDVLKIYQLTSANH